MAVGGQPTSPWIALTSDPVALSRLDCLLLIGMLPGICASRARQYRGEHMATATLDGFRALIENSSDAIFLVNPKTEIMYASASTAKVLGYQPAELLGRNGLELLHPQDREDSSRALKEVLAKPHSPTHM